MRLADIEDGDMKIYLNSLYQSEESNLHNLEIRER